MRKHFLLFLSDYILWVRGSTEINVTCPVLYPRVKNMRASPETTYPDHPSASAASHMIESPAKLTDVLNSSRLPREPAFISPLCLLVCFLLISFLSAYVSMHFSLLFLVVVAVCEKIEFIWGSSQVSCGVRPGPDRVFVCVRDRERRYKNLPELIAELRQPRR